MLISSNFSIWHGNMVQMQVWMLWMNFSPISTCPHKDSCTLEHQVAWDAAAQVHWKWGSSFTARNSPPTKAIGPNIARRSPWTAWWKQLLLNAIKRPGFTSTTCWFRADSSVKMSEPVPLNQMITVWLLTMRPFQTSRWLLTSPRLIMAGRIAIGRISPISAIPKALCSFWTRWPGTCTLALRPVPLFTKPGSWKFWNWAKPCCSNCAKAEFSSGASRKSSMMMRSDIGCSLTRVRLVLNSIGSFEHCNKSYTSIMPHWYSIAIDSMPVGCLAKSSFWRWKEDCCWKFLLYNSSGLLFLTSSVFLHPYKSYWW